MLMQTFAEPHGPAEAVDHTELRCRGPSGRDADEEATVVRAEIDGREASSALSMAATDLCPLGRLNNDQCHILALPP